MFRQTIRCKIFLKSDLKSVWSQIGGRINSSWIRFLRKNSDLRTNPLTTTCNVVGVSIALESEKCLL
ncbi:hypothetical protein DLM78_07935 [Leptospira stimsonii]|uniref:Uncharacterized protein n=1 Tax=Leptospira stimsonii TaxID=2202203 RepID=A0A8B3CXF4_9LEPT|nr:hypothetical protein DLM78_07935 [Leptospira stimsonii]